MRRRQAAPLALAPAVLAACLAVAAASPAHAGPLAEPHLGGMVFVGPASPHPSAIFWNPAAAGLMRGLHVYFAGTGRLDVTSVDRDRISTADGEPTTQSTGSRGFDPLTTTVLSPGGFVGVSWDLNTEQATAGIAVYTPFAERLPANHPALQYHTNGGSFYATYTTVSVSFRLATRIIFGLGLSLVFSRVDLRFAEDEALQACAAPPCDAENPDAAQRYRLVTGETLVPAVSFNGGLMVKLTPRLWVGASYITAPRSVERSDIPKNGDVTVDPAPRGALGQLTGEARLTFRLPQMAHLGARYELVPEAWYLLAGARWLDMSVHRQYDLRMSGPELRDAGVEEWVLRYRGFQDVYSLDVGVENPSGRRVRVGARLRYESSAVPTELVAPEQVDGHKLEVAGGLEYKLTPGLAMTLGGSFAIQLPENVAQSGFSPSARVDCVASGYDLDRCEAAREGSALPTAAGDYTRMTFGFMLGLSYDRL